MFDVIIQKLESRMKRDVDDTMSRVSTMTCGDILKTRYTRDLLTNAAFDIVKLLKPEEELPAKVIDKIKVRTTHQNLKRLKADLAKLGDAIKADDPDDITISVNWNRSRTWGMNPAVVVSAGGETTEGSASGCGYDKESAAVAAAMNKNASVRRLWCSFAEGGFKFPYSMVCDNDSPIPFMDGGCGMSSVRAVFEALGYDWYEHHGKAFDYYRATKKGECAS